MAVYTKILIDLIFKFRICFNYLDYPNCTNCPDCPNCTNCLNGPDGPRGPRGPKVPNSLGDIQAPGRLLAENRV